MSLALLIVRRLDTFTPVPSTLKNVTVALLLPPAALQPLRRTAVWHVQEMLQSHVVAPAD